MLDKLRLVVRYKGTPPCILSAIFRKETLFCDFVTSCQTLGRTKPVQLLAFSLEKSVSKIENGVL